MSAQSGIMIDVLHGFGEATYHRWVAGLSSVFRAWPDERQLIAVEWSAWLFSISERTDGYPVLREFVEQQNACAGEEHIGCDDAGKYSLHGASSLLFGILIEKFAKQTAMVPLRSAEDVACKLRRGHPLFVHSLGALLKRPLSILCE